MTDSKSKFTHHATTLRNKFELEKRHHFEVVKNLPISPSKQSQKQRVGSKAMELEEIVKHMSNLPSYLERGKPIHDKALTFGVIDWGRLEKWQYHHHKRSVVKSNRYSPSSSNSSLFSTDGASPQSSRGQSFSPIPQKLHYVPLQSPKGIASPYVKTCLGNLDKFQDMNNAPIDQSSEKKTANLLETNRRGVKMNLFHPQNIPESRSLKGKMKIQDDLVNELGIFQDSCRGHKNVVLPATEVSVDSQRSFSEDVVSDKNDNASESCSLQTEVVNFKISRNESYFSRKHNSPPRRKTPEEKRSIFEVVNRKTSRNETNFSYHNSPSRNKTPEGKKSNFDLKTGTITTSRERSMSPLRRFSFSMSSKSLAPTTATKKAEDSPPSSQNSTKDNSYASDRANSSPLRRLLKIKDSRTKEKKLSSSIKQALFKTDVKNGRPLFTFAVENNSDIIAATMRSCVYTFFTVKEVKKKYGGWLSQGTKGKNYGYVPNIAAQMKVSDPSVSNNNGEFVLFSVDPSQFDYQMSTVKPQEELAAIVVKLLRKVEEEDDQDSFETTVILPGGSHGIPSKGQPSPLIQRWRSGGVCDCGGWDMGCGLRTLTNEVQVKSQHLILQCQGEVQKGKPFFSISLLKEGLYSVEFNSSLSLLQAFSICISVVECRKWSSSHHTEVKSCVGKQVQDQAPVTYAPFPPLSPVARV